MIHIDNPFHYVTNYQLVITCGMYPILFPGIPIFRSPGIPPKTETNPLSIFFKPTIVDNTVVFPHPLAPNKQ